jgi:hypothetical protein
MRAYAKVVSMILFGMIIGSIAPAVKAAPRALVVDYEMNPPVVLARLLEDLSAAGFEAAYRPFYPRLTRSDLRSSSLVILLSGDGPGYPGTGMSAASVEPLQAYVRAGGALILGPLSGDAQSEGGDHDRYLFNILLHRLGVPIRIDDDWIMDDENAYPTPLYWAPFARLVVGHPITRGLGERMVTDRSPSLEVREGATVLVRTYPSAYPRGRPSERESYPLVAIGGAGGGTVAVASRYMLAWGGGNGKEPARSLLPLPEEDVLRAFLRSLLGYVHEAVTSGTTSDVRASHVGFSPPARPDFPLVEEAIPEAPPPAIEEDHGWQPVGAACSQRLDASYNWIQREGVRSGWAHIDRDLDELESLSRGLKQSGMNLLWGVGFPQLFSSPKGTPEARDKLLSCWEKVAHELAGSPVKWFVGMEYPGRYASEESMPYAVGAEGRSWKIPSPWDREVWRREVIGPAKLVAQWARTSPAVAGMVVDLEMYGRIPLVFGQGVDFGDAPFGAFLNSKGWAAGGKPWQLSPRDRFPWLRDRGLLKDYYSFLEERAQEMGQALRDAVRAVHPDLILGCYVAGIFHRWFYRGLWRGMSEPSRPILLFTFQRDPQIDLAELRASGIHALHVRGLLMGMFHREDYLPLFRDSLSRNWGYWLNRLTSLVASTGFYPIEAPKGMTQQEAWQAIGEANRKAPFKKGR